MRLTVDQKVALKVHYWDNWLAGKWVAVLAA